MKAGEYFRHLRQQLETVYDSGEAAAIAEMVYVQYTGMNRAERVRHSEEPVAGTGLASMNSALEALLTLKPVQYVLGEAEFCGNRFVVNEKVLIPRPETELLVEMAVNKLHETGLTEPVNVLDIGTGSGCIALSIKKQIPEVRVWGIDKSAEALSVARENARRLQANVEWREMDMTVAEAWQPLPEMQLIVSNPPYIPPAEFNSLHKNVTDFEPHIALFTPGEDALFFYRHIAILAKKKLVRGGWLLCETHADYAQPVAALFAENGFSHVTVIKDMFEKERVVAGSL